MSGGLPLFDHATAAKKRDRGMSLAAAAQDADAPGWSHRAYEAIVRVAHRQADVFVDDVLAEFSEAPAHHNSWGAVWHRAIRENVIVHSGRVKPSKDIRKNSHRSPVYSSRLFKGEHNA